MEEKKAKSEKVGVGAWIALIVLILILSGAFRTMDGPIKVLDFTNLSGAFGTIGDTGANLIGSGGTGAKDGFMAGFNLIPAVMFFCGPCLSSWAPTKPLRSCSVPCCAPCWASPASAASLSSPALPAPTWPRL